MLFTQWRTDICFGVILMTFAHMHKGYLARIGRLGQFFAVLALLSIFINGASSQGFSFISPSAGQAQAIAPDSVVVMPFENRSQMAKYNWIRDSFAILLGDVLDVPGISVLSVDERNMAFDKMNLSPSD